MHNQSLQILLLVLSLVLLSRSQEIRAPHPLSHLQSDIQGRATLVDDASALNARRKKGKGKPKDKDNSEENEHLFYKFVTRPDIGAPKWDVKVYDKDALSPGYWFVAPYAHLHQSSYSKWNGPHIYDDSGELIWSGAPMFKHYNTYDFRTVEFDGKQMASLIYRQDEDGVIFDNTYQVHKTVNMIPFIPQWILDILGDERKTNMHDFNVIENGKRVIMLTKVFENATIEESRAIGYEGNCTAKYQGLREVDIATGKTIFDWSAHGHIGLEESTFRKRGGIQKACNGNLGKGGWDILHLNAGDKFPDGDYLISSRHTDALYKISHINGSIVWRLGGVKSDFELTDDAKFSRQHHARVHSQNDTHTVVTVFDNARGTGGGQGPTNTQSRGLVIALRTDTQPMTAELVGQYGHPEGQWTSARGSMQILPNNNAFVCWSGATQQSEHAPDGKLLMESKFRLDGANSYRSYKYPWVGRPSSPPDVHSAAIDIGPNNTSTLVHVSWNGATEVKTWNLYKTNANGGAAQLVASTLKQGFETALTCDGYAGYVLAEALDIDGKVLGRSGIFKTVPPSDPMDPSVVLESKWLQEHSLDEPGDSTDLSSPLSGRSIFKNPVVLFFLGLVACIFVVAVVWSTRSSRREKLFWWRNKNSKYGRLSGSAEERGEPEEERLRGDQGEETLVEEENEANEKTGMITVEDNDHR